MFYHVRITQKSDRKHDEVKLDLSDNELHAQFIERYVKGEPIIIQGKTILTEDIERIRISQTEEDSSKILPRVKYEVQQSNVFVIGGPSYEWLVADKGKDITDELIKGPAGYKVLKYKETDKDKIKIRKSFITYIKKRIISVVITAIGILIVSSTAPWWFTAIFSGRRTIVEFLPKDFEIDIDCKYTEQYNLCSS